MSAEEAAKQVEQSIEMLRKAADALAQGLPHLQRELKQSSETKANLDRTSKLLVEAEGQLSTVSDSLAKIESAILQSMNTAKDGLHDPSISLDTRLQMLKVCKELFAKLAAAGFYVTIPEIGASVDMNLHNVKGKARSKLGKSEIADVIAWGYSFPSGQSQLADVLVGDASLLESEEEPVAHAPTAKAGIAMVLDEETARQKQTTKKTPDTLFDKLAEAAERNKEQ